MRSSASSMPAPPPRGAAVPPSVAVKASSLSDAAVDAQDAGAPAARPGAGGGGARAMVLVGTSGFSYAHWRNGAFYPRGCDDELKHLARVLSFCEINSSFYAFPSDKSMARWGAPGVAPPWFRLTLKTPKAITHDCRLGGQAASMSRDFAARAAAALGRRLGPILLQTPPSLRRDDALLEDVLSHMRRALDDSGAAGVHVGIACEFRHTSWMNPDVAAILCRHGACFVEVVVPWVNPDGSCASAGPSPMLWPVTENTPALSYIRMAHSEEQEKAIGHTEFGDAQLKVSRAVECNVLALALALTTPIFAHTKTSPRCSPGNSRHDGRPCVARRCSLRS